MTNQYYNIVKYLLKFTCVIVSIFQRLNIAEIFQASSFINIYSLNNIFSYQDTI